MKTIDDLNISQWFTTRELTYVPSHFVSTNTKVTDESYRWILEKLTGRFVMLNVGVAMFPTPAFEDPKEALFYELTWG